MCYTLVTGDFWFADIANTIAVKSGFSQLFGLDVKQEVNAGPVSFIGADAPVIAGNLSILKSWASDNTAAPPVRRR